MKHYTDILRVGHKDTLDYFTNIASQNKTIRIMTKLDGANGQFEVENGVVNVYSRNNLLDESNNLRNFYQYVTSKVDPNLLPPGLKVFGEWLVSHTVTYPNEMYNHFYIFDIFDTRIEKYIDPKSETYQTVVDYLVNVCGMKLAEVLYEGPYRGIDHVESFLRQVVRSEVVYTGQKPTTAEEVFNEGIVIKSYDYVTKYGNQLFIKMVSERFKEVAKKEPKVAGPDTTLERQIADFAATKARVEKMLNKMVDEGKIPADLDMEHIPTIIKELPRRIYEDIMKEELETIKEQFGEFDEKVIGKKINSNVTNFVREIIREKVEERIKSLR